MREDLLKELQEAEKQIKSLELSKEMTETSLKFYKAKVKLLHDHLGKLPEVKPLIENSLSKDKPETR